MFFNEIFQECFLEYEVSVPKKSFKNILLPGSFLKDLRPGTCTTLAGMCGHVVDYASVNSVKSCVKFRSVCIFFWVEAKAKNKISGLSRKLKIKSHLVMSGDILKFLTENITSPKVQRSGTPSLSGSMTLGNTGVSNIPYHSSKFMLSSQLDFHPFCKISAPYSIPWPDYEYQ